MKTSFWITLACSLFYLAAALACLIRWNQPQPFSSFDFFSGGYLCLRLLGSIYSLLSSRAVFHSALVKEQWWALDSDPEGPQWVMVLMALDLVVFLDYGHWHLLPWLARPALQVIGLGIYAAVALWQVWTDAYLARYFNGQEPPFAPMDRGPYRYVRHPRYAAAIVGKLAMAVTFASIVAWLLAIAWAVLLLNKMAVEEKHLRKVFGMSYDSYARSTARVIPGIY